jgi:hypothetical protein
MYTGPTDDLVTWFSSLGYYYDPETHGMASDWALDLVSLGFTKPGNQHQQQPASPASIHATASQQQQLKHRNRSVQLRAAAAESSSSSKQQRASFLMTSKQELTDAADSFLVHLEQQHPDWFANPPRSTVVTTTAGGTAALLTRLDSYTSRDGAPGLATQSHASSSSSPHNASAVVVGCISSLRSTSDQADKAGDEIQHELLVPKAVGSSTKPITDGPGDSWSGRFTGGFCKYKALLGRELLITTRLV